MGCPKPHRQRHRGTAGPLSLFLLNVSSGLHHWERVDPGTCLSCECMFPASPEGGRDRVVVPWRVQPHIYYQPENANWTLGRTCQCHGAGEGSSRAALTPHPTLRLPSPASGTWQDPWLAVLGLVAGFLCFSAWQELEQLGKLLQGL